MATPNDPKGRPRDAENWADPVASLKLGEVPADAINLNVEGRRAVGPLQGLGLCLDYEPFYFGAERYHRWGEAVP